MDQNTYFIIADVQKMYKQWRFLGFNTAHHSFWPFFVGPINLNFRGEICGSYYTALARGQEMEMF